ncbi:hypothetical protein EKH55_3398 [Sinorhizobium alkalisoli]|nr:hypothetical protein EKH55_3398 [Sinorhizobium alkalisoli]
MHKNAEARERLFAGHGLSLLSFVRAPGCTQACSSGAGLSALTYRHPLRLPAPARRRSCRLSKRLAAPFAFAYMAFDSSPQGDLS